MKKLTLLLAAFLAIHSLYAKDNIPTWLEVQEEAQTFGETKFPTATEARAKANGAQGSIESIHLNRDIHDLELKILRAIDNGQFTTSDLSYISSEDAIIAHFDHLGYKVECSDTGEYTLSYRRFIKVVISWEKK